MLQNTAKMAFFVGESYLKYPAYISLDLCKKRECKKREIYEFCQYIAYRWFSLYSLQPPCSIFLFWADFPFPPTRRRPFLKTHAQNSTILCRLLDTILSFFWKTKKTNSLLFLVERGGKWTTSSLLKPSFFFFSNENGPFQLLSVPSPSKNPSVEFPRLLKQPNCLVIPMLPNIFSDFPVRLAEPKKQSKKWPRSTSKLR